MSDKIVIELECDDWSTVMWEDVHDLVSRKDVTNWYVRKVEGGEVKR